MTDRTDTHATSAQDLKGKNVVIIGGSSGMGMATAKSFALKGAQVSITGRSAEKLAQAQQTIGLPVTTAAFDGADEDAVQKFLSGVGTIDYLILVAGGGGIVGSFADLDLKEFRAAFERKFWVQVAAAKYGAGLMRENGSITFVTGIFGLKPLRGMSGVAAVNGALNAMIGPIAIELAPVRVNAVSPGTVDTPYWGRMKPEAREKLYAERARNHLVGRIGQPEEAADFIFAVATNTFLTGVVIPLDGGFAMGGPKS
jgi:NAD(P)-dependent dehydrogenase (short-subunit alcohol dehydrogenase family)